LIPPSTVARVLFGSLRGASWVVGSATHGCWLGTYERASQRLAASLVLAGDVVYDIGANVGFFTLLFSRLAGERGSVASFEPVPRNLEFLRLHLSLNHGSNVTIVEKAVGDHAGNARFRLGANSAQGGLDASGELEVALTTVDHEVFELGRPAPNLLKLDVEGAEPRVLAGACRTMATRGPVLWIETHGWKAHEECRRILLERDYRFRLEKETGQSGHGSLVAEKLNCMPGASLGRSHVQIG
jgi:FkbM family methyltransferase